MDIGGQDNIPRPRYTAGQIIGRLREAEVLLGHPDWNAGQVGRRWAKVAGARELATTTYHRPAQIVGPADGEKSMVAFGRTRRKA